MAIDPSVAQALEQLCRNLYPGGRMLAAELLAPDSGATDDTQKGAGYGAPIRIRLVDAEGKRHVVVLRTEGANDFGHDRRADRAEGVLLSFDTFGAVPSHIRPIDVGAIAADGRLISLRDSGELYLVTTYAEGSLYADDLRRVARDGIATARDEERAVALARYLVALHAEKGGRPAVYRRAIRDLVGHGEGIFGVVDAYPEDTPGASPARLRSIERGCLEWRWKLRAHAARLARTHGDFHPFNVVFDEGGELTLLDASRGCRGDPADDLSCMAVNYPFFALAHPGSWERGLGPLWRGFLSAYLDGSGDYQLLEVAAPYFAWRCLVLACPAFYPSLHAEARDRLLGFAERVLDAPRFDPAMIEELGR